MKFLCLSDYRGAREFLHLISLKIAEESPDAIFYCGGSMKGALRIQEYETARKFHSKPSMDSPEIQKEVRQDEEHLQQFTLALADTQKPVYVVPGLSDAPESLYFKSIYNYSQVYPNLQSVHEQVVKEEGFLVAGFGGDMGAYTDDREFLLQYTTPWSDFALRKLQYMPGEKILLTHSPPVCRLDLSDGEHYGVLSLNELVERVAPKLLVCGRAHSSQGKILTGPTTVVNPGPLFKGQYAVVEYPSLECRFETLVHPSALE